MHELTWSGRAGWVDRRYSRGSGYWDQRAGPQFAPAFLRFLAASRSLYVVCSCVARTRLLHREAVSESAINEKRLLILACSREGCHDGNHDLQEHIGVGAADSQIEACSAVVERSVTCRGCDDLSIVIDIEVLSQLFEQNSCDEI